MDTLDRTGLLADYRAELRRNQKPRALKASLSVLFTINTVFIAVDWWAFRDQFGAFLRSRIALDFLIALLFVRTRHHDPETAELVGSLATGAMLLTVIYGTGGPTSDYYAGLLLLFFAIPVLLAVSAAEAGVIVSILTAGFLVPPFLMDGPDDWRVFGVHALFLLGAAFASVTASGLLDRIRFTDFARRRELEVARDQLAQLDRAKSRFTANVHHELRTPLTLMLAPLESMLSGDFGAVSEVQQSYLRTMHVNGLRLLKLINNLLDLARAESGTTQLSRREIQLGRIAEDVVSGARPMAERKAVEFATSGLEELPSIFADPDAVEKIVVNLVGNALKFTPEGGRIELLGEPEDGGVHLRVIDTGIGLAAEDLSRIFDRFAQVDASATRRHEGTGIGLSLAKELVELHGGRIWAESAGVGLGATLHVWLPRGEPDPGMSEEVLQTAEGRSVRLEHSMGALEAEIDFEKRSQPAYRTAEFERTVSRLEDGAEPAAAAGAAVPADAQAVPADAPEVVIAEDNAEMRRLLVFLVGREFRVRAARNGLEALAMVHERLPDLVVTDVMMPELSGTDLCRALKEDAATRGVPVVLVTSKAEREMKIEGLELGADDYVTKPFHPRELMARVRSLVRLRRLQGELARRNVELERALREVQEYEVQLVRAERLAAVGELAAGVAHEVNNPVNFAVNALGALRDHVEKICELARRVEAVNLRDTAKLASELEALRSYEAEVGVAELQAELGELVEIASEGLHRTHRLVGDLRDFAAPGRGLRTPFDLRQGLRSTAQLLGQSLAEAGVRLELDLAADLPRVEADAAALNQVFLNLLKNSREALENSGGTIRVAARRAGDRVQVEIADDGPGLPDEVRDRLFQPFVTTKEAGRGTGLGLSICHRIVTEHGGRLEATSEPGKGTVFTITLPAEPMHAA